MASASFTAPCRPINVSPRHSVLVLLPARTCPALVQLLGYHGLRELHSAVQTHDCHLTLAGIGVHLGAVRDLDGNACRLLDVHQVLTLATQNGTHIVIWQVQRELRSNLSQHILRRGGPGGQHHTLVGSELHGGLHVRGKLLMQGQRVEDERHATQHLVPSPQDRDGAFRVAGGELRQGLHAHSGSRVIDDVPHGLAFVANQQPAQAPGQRQLHLILMICAFVHHCHLALAGQGISGHFLQNHEDGGEHGVKGSRQQQHAVRGARVELSRARQLDPSSRRALQLFDICTSFANHRACNGVAHEHLGHHLLGTVAPHLLGLAHGG
mmetsp:Transcript_279/g.646  ORF Transcript_279/g.646 Transcript_279/m.646 type:complete len:324 (-) Transcript_279:126-1097(-)